MRVAIWTNFFKRFKCLKMKLEFNYKIWYYIIEVINKFIYGKSKKIHQCIFNIIPGSPG